MEQNAGSQRAGFEDGSSGLRTESRVEASEVSSLELYIERASNRGVQGRGVVGKGPLRWLAAVQLRCKARRALSTRRVFQSAYVNRVYRSATSPRSPSLAASLCLQPPCLKSGRPARRSRQKASRTSRACVPDLTQYRSSLLRVGGNGEESGHALTVRSAH